MTNSENCNSDSFGRTRGKAVQIMCGLLYLIFLCWLYYPILGSYFANDDWVILWHAHLIPLSEPWRFFSMQTIWFYRPLQSLQYALTWHFAGANYAWYTMQLLVMHFGVCALVWCLFRGLFGTAVATLSVIIYSVNCLAPDILLWAANFNNLQYALITLASANLFLAYIKSRKRAWLISAVVMAALNSFTKESCVNLPLVLAAVWITRYLQTRWHPDQFPPDATKYRFTQFIKNLIPFAVVTIVYAGLHLIFYKNTESRYLLEYGFATPLTALAHLSHTVNVSLFGYITNPLGFVFGAAVGRAAANVLLYGYILAPAILGLAIYRGSPAAVFAVLFAAAIQFPTFALQKYHASRYYYLSISAGILLAAVIIWPPLSLLGRYMFSSAERAIGNLAVSRRIAGYTAAIFLVAILAANIIFFQNALGAKNQEANYLEQTFNFLKAAGPSVPKDSLIIFRLSPNNSLHNGLGATEMIGLATGRRDILGVTNDFQFPDILKNELNKRPDKFVLDVYTTHPQLIAI